MRQRRKLFMINFLLHLNFEATADVYVVAENTVVIRENMRPVCYSKWLFLSPIKCLNVPNVQIRSL